ncbi:family 4 glycosyl hydrolase [Bacillus solitudinis]|uniref:family 4 glycosyl hydrolase n=1 Tax=Bacillus solitudinis TaxID=2014074 RepID=UPI000C24FA37|nr:alpha-glucosidase/alpha-galactosidase [Bacillus solitudinis]
MNVYESVSNVKIAYIGGGSRGWAWGLMSDLAMEPQLSGHVKLYDVNLEAAQSNEKIGNRLSERKDVVGKWTYEAVQTLAEALEGADFVIISILPGTFHQMRSDVHLPEQYGIYQSVGDTVGPGGLIRALRTIPMYVEFAEAIKEYCPDAWVINFTNPMTLCVRTLYEVFPKIKAIGCCHEVFGTQKLLARMVEELQGDKQVHRAEIKVNVLGINHFTWIDKATYQGTDLMPLYDDFANKYYKEGYELSSAGHWMNSTFASAHRIHFDLFLKFGLIAAAGDRHLAEFMPLHWYLKNPETVKSWKFGLTTVEWRLENRDKLIETSKKLVSGEESVELKSTGEESIGMMKALLGLEDLITNVNMPNRGQMGGIKEGAVVETNAYFSADSVRPVLAGTLPPSINKMVVAHSYNQETILKAALEKDKKLAFSAFLNDPLVMIDVKSSSELFNQMLVNTKEYLPGWEL